MGFLNNNLLTLLIFLPSVGALILLPMRSRDTVRWVALGTTLVTFLASLLLFATFDWHKGGAYAYMNDAGGVVQMVQEANWIPAFNIKYKVGIDGLSFPLVLLSTFICL